MIKMNEGNVLIIENEGMTLDVEDDIHEGISMSLYVPQAFITMTGLYTNKELERFRTDYDDNFHAVVKSSKKSILIGKKKVLETIFSTRSIESKDLKDYRIIFSSEDTRIEFPMTKEDWEELVSYIQFIGNGYKHLKK